MRTVAAGVQHTCALDSEGSVSCWGDWRQTGMPTAPERVPDIPEPLVSISAGLHTCGLTADGRAYCWGRNQKGQLGLGTTSLDYAAGLVATDERFADIAPGYDHTCALTLNGVAYCWGHGEMGRLGDGGSDTEAFRPQPVAGNATFETIDASLRTCGATADGRVLCWGGIAGFIPPSPVGPLPGACRQDGYLPWYGSGPCTLPTPVRGASGISQVTVGGISDCGLASGTVWCWGLGSVQELGSVGEPGRPAPIMREAVRMPGLEQVATVGLGGSHACALIEDGTTVCWGGNAHHQLGRGVDGSGLEASGTPAPVLFGGEFSELSVGSRHSCGLDARGDVWCWGSAAAGEVGYVGEPAAIPVLVERPAQEP